MPDAGAPAFGFKAAFAAAAFVLLVVGVYALERVGAPDALVAALGPLVGVIGIMSLGVLTRTKTLLDFLVARRSVPPLYIGLALAASIGGFALALAGSASDASRLPWRGASVGVALAVLFVGPRWRAAQASALADVLATRFPSVFARTTFMLVFCACGWSLGAAGLGYAALTVRGALGVSPDVALGLSTVALVLSLAPGGLRSLVWIDAASAAAGLMTMALFAALSAGAGADRLDTASRTLGALPGAPFVQEIAAAAATASLFAFVTPALAAASAKAARRAGLTALVVLAAGGAAAATLGQLDLKGPGDSSLAGLVAFLPAMALARGAIHSASRARGLDLAQVHRGLWVLASRRMAVLRGGVVLGAVVAAYGARIAPQPSAPLYLGLALWLAFAAPSLLLAMLPGRSAAPALAALAGALATAFAGHYAGFGDSATGPDMLVGAFGAGLGGLAAGLCVFVLRPGKALAPAPDPFVDLPIQR